MRQARYTDDGLTVVDVEPPPLPDDWVRLNVASCGICGTDLHIYQQTARYGRGVCPGHEFAGVIAEGGAGLADALYAVDPTIHCRTCEFCLGGMPQFCAGYRTIGIFVDGGSADSVVVPRYTLHPVDPSVPKHLASQAEPLAVGVRGIHVGPLEPDSRALVLGAGAIGLVTGLLARDRARRVAITARYPHQRACAEALGLEAIGEDEAEDWSADNMPDVVYETVGGTADTILLSMLCARKGGTIVVLGSFNRETVEISPLLLLSKELHLTASLAYGRTRRGSEFGAAVAMLPRYATELEKLSTHRFPLDRADDAFKTALDKSTESIKVSIAP